VQKRYLNMQGGNVGMRGRSARRNAGEAHSSQQGARESERTMCREGMQVCRGRMRAQGQSARWSAEQSGEYVGRGHFAALETHVGQHSSGAQDVMAHRLEAVKPSGCW
jgi:hypothetical protein